MGDDSTNANPRRLLATIQPYGLEDFGGTSRILRTLLTAPSIASVSIATWHRRPLSTKRISQSWVRSAFVPDRLCRGRIARIGRFLEAAQFRHFRARLRAELQELNPSVVHSVVMSEDCLIAFAWAKENNVPFLLSVHDDIRHLLKNQPRRLRYFEEQLVQVWREATVCFVIGEEMGEEYNRRYGRRPYRIVTDGADEVRREPRHQPKDFTLYFCGGLNLPYVPNFLCAQKAVGMFARDKGLANVRFVCRGGWRIPGQSLEGPQIEVRDFVSDSMLDADLEEASLLYLPLPFDRENENFCRYSLSTKCVTYLASGIPILYHGPQEAALATMLQSAAAARMVFSDEVTDLAAELNRWCRDPNMTVPSALKLAKDRFNPNLQRKAFWDGVALAIRQPDLPRKVT